MVWQPLRITMNQRRNESIRRVQISFEKNKFIMNITATPGIMNTYKGKIEKVKSIKYVGEMNQDNCLEKQAIKARI